MSIFSIVLAELYKISRRRGLILLGAVYWLLVPTVLLLVTPTLRSAIADVFSGSRVLMQTLASPFGLATVGTGIGGYSSPSLFFVIVAVVAIALIGDDTRFSTWKSTLVLQPRRFAVLFGKLIAGHLIVLLVLLGNVLGSIIVGGIGTTYLGTTFEGDWTFLLQQVFLQWIFLLTPLIFAFLVVFYIRSTGLAIILILFLMPVVELILEILRNIARFNPVSQLAQFFQHDLVEPIWKALPDWQFTTNVFGPSRDVFNPVLGMLGGGFQPVTSGGWHSVLVLAVYSAVFLALFVPAFLRRDVP